MALPAPSIIDDYTQTPPADTIASYTDPYGQPLKVNRVPQYRTSAYTVPASGAIWCGNDGGTHGLADGSSFANRYGSIDAALAAEEGSGSNKTLVLVGPSHTTNELVIFRGPFASAAAFASSSKFSAVMAAPGALPIFKGSKDITSGWTDSSGTGVGPWSHAYTALAPLFDPQVHGQNLAAGINATAGTITLDQSMPGAMKVVGGSLVGYLVQIGSEWIWVNAASSDQKTLTAGKRGARGTTPAAHAAGAAVKKVMFPQDQLFFDGKPFRYRMNDTAGTDEFWVDENANKIWISTDPSTASLIEASGWDDINHGAGEKAGLVFQGVSFQHWGCKPGGGNSDPLPVIRGPKLQDCTFGFNAWQDLTWGNDHTLDQAAFYNAGLSLHAYTDQNRHHQHYRVHHANWRMYLDIHPSAVARFAGEKNAASVDPLDEWVLFTTCYANGKWDDVRNKGVRVYHFTALDCLGYGYTHEVGGESAANPPTYVDIIVARCGLDHGDNFRISGLFKAQVWHLTSFDSYGAELGWYEDSREYAGSSTQQRALTGGGSPGLGDSALTVAQNLVLVRTRASKPAFYSVNGVVGSFGGEGPSSGWQQTAALATEQMFSKGGISDLTRGMGDDYWLAVDLTANDGAEKPYQWATPTGASRSATTVLSLAGVHARGHGNQANSRTAGKKVGLQTLADIFPNLAASGAVTFKDIDGMTGAVPGEGGSVLGATIPANIAAILLGGSPGATQTKLGAYDAPLPVALNSVAALSIDTAATLDDATIGASYAVTITGSGGSGTGYTWTIPTTGIAKLTAHALTAATVGSNLVVSGTPTGSDGDQITFFVTLTDDAGHTATRTFKITFNAAGSFSISTSELPDAQEQHAYSPVTIGFANATGTASITAVDNLPSGMTFTTTTIGGTPASGTRTSAPITVTIHAHDSAGSPHTATKDLTLTVTDAGIAPTAAWNNSATPAPGATISSPQTLTVNASDDHALPVNAVQLLTGPDAAHLTPTGVFFALAGTVATLTLDPNDFPAGPLTVRADVTDDKGLTNHTFARNYTIVHSGDTTPPAITEITFADGTTLTIPTDLTATLTDPSGIARAFARIDLGGGRYLDIPMTPVPPGGA